MKKNTFIEISYYDNGSRQETILISKTAFINLASLANKGYLVMGIGRGTLNKILKIAARILEDEESKGGN